jgi:AraC-like DNA-binding protein
MLTAKTDIKDQIEGIGKGAEAYIVKPFNMEYLKTVAKNLLSQRVNVIAHYTGPNAPLNGELRITPKDEEFMNKLIGYIDENYSATMSIDSLSAYCNVSRTVLYNKIKGLTGLSPHEFLRRKKLNIAAGLLKNGYNVSEAAFKTGFQDVKYFSRLFKSQFGYSPSKHDS